MADSDVVAALAAKRAEVADELRRTLKDVGRLRAEIDHLDGAIRLFTGGTDSLAIPTPNRRVRNGLFGFGELPALILDALRASEIPLSNGALVPSIMQSKGLNPNDDKLRAKVAEATSRVLERLRHRKLVQGARRLDGRYEWMLVA